MVLGNGMPEERHCAVALVDDRIEAASQGVIVDVEPLGVVRKVEDRR